MNSTPLLAASVESIESISEILNSPDCAREVRERIKKGEIFVVRAAADAMLLENIKRYLVGVASCSFPNYHAISHGCPNHHRINNSDPRAYVKGCFHQFSFFPWNQDVFDFFNAFRDLYRVKNLINGLKPDKFMGMEPEDGCTARLAFQFYPAGIGYLNKHADPVDHHQLVVPTLTMSSRGLDFKTGGAYVIGADGKKLYTDDISTVGDLVLFDARIHHGVEMIDEGSTPDWLTFQGRWMLLLATNKIASNTNISNAIDLGMG